MTFSLVLGVALALLSLTIFVRNNAVFVFREKLINEIHDANVEDINAGDLVMMDRRWEIFEEISYNAMVFKVWRKVDGFYDRAALCLPERECQ